MASSSMDKYPSISDLAQKAKQRIPGFAWEYLDSGTGADETRDRNLADLAQVLFTPELLKGPLEPSTETTLFGHTYSLPIGIAPIGLTGLIWPGADSALATAATEANIPHILSTVATTSPEIAGPLTKGNGWFQLYPPRDATVRTDLLSRVKSGGFRVLVVTADVPAASRRERQRKAQIRVPTAIGPRLVGQAALRPAWTRALFTHGFPRLQTLEKYVDAASMQQTAGFVGANLGGTLSWKYLEELRTEWDGPLVVKGILSPDDAERCVESGADSVYVSNHGGRQLDGSPSSISALPAVVDRVAGRVPVLFDSGVRDGLDVARALALGADFVFAGRPFMFGLSALGDMGALHALEILNEGLVNVMHQVGVERISDLASRLA